MSTNFEAWSFGAENVDVTSEQRLLRLAHGLGEIDQIVANQIVGFRSVSTVPNNMMSHQNVFFLLLSESYYSCCDQTQFFVQIGINLIGLLAQSEDVPVFGLLAVVM
jgi:hypothetical protein